MSQDGKTEYKGITVAEDSTAEEFMDFYLDDHTRAQWVSMHAVLATAFSMTAPHIHLAGNGSVSVCKRRT